MLARPQTLPVTALKDHLVVHELLVAVSADPKRVGPTVRAESPRERHTAV